MTSKKDVKKKQVKTQEHVEKFSDSDIELWADSLLNGVAPEEVETIEKMSTRVANIGDMTALALHFDRASKAEIMQSMNMLVKRMSVMDYILTDKLGVTQEDMKEYAEKYENELAEVRAEIERLQKEKEKANEQEEE